MENKRSLNVFILTMINVAAICNIKNFPLTSLYGLSTVFFYILAAIVFFIPVSLVSAELATGWPQRGVYIWVREALGPRMGFIAVWLQWVENIIWYPTILSFIAATVAYIFNPSLANNKIYILLVILTSFWLVTILNFYGMKLSGWISSVAALFGTILPGILIIFLGIIWVMTGNPSQTPLEKEAFFPNLTSINQLVIFAGMLLTLAGMEMSSVHAKEAKNPQKDYPKSIFLAAVIILILSSLGSLAVSVVVSKSEINLAAGSMEAFSIFLRNYGFDWAIPIIAFIMAIGALGMMSTWIVGPTKGIFASALDGDLPKIFQKVNQRSMPVSLLITQGILVTALSLVFLFMPDVSSSYWILVNLTVELYLVMYILMFISAIVLRYRQPHVERAYKIPFKNVGMWIISSVGTIACTLVLILGLFPPEQIETGNVLYYEAFLIGGMLLFLLIPYFIYESRKESWKSTQEY